MLKINSEKREPLEARNTSNKWKYSYLSLRIDNVNPDQMLQNVACDQVT